MGRVSGGNCPADVSRETTCVGVTFAMPPFLSPVDEACILLSLDVTNMLRALSFRDTVPGSVENSCHNDMKLLKSVSQVGKCFKPALHW